jgi:DNA-binding HxlR family transcriptional regulator
VPKPKEPILASASMIHLVLEQVASKWAVLVITGLCEKPQRFNEIKRRLDGVTQKALTETLRRLERNGLIARRVIPVSPVAVEYSLTRLGRTLQDPFVMLSEWAIKHRPDIEEAQQSFHSRQQRPSGNSTD